MDKKISSKTNGLIVLNNKLNLNSCSVPKFIYFTKFDYIKDKNKIFEKIKKNFKKEIIIRSSSLSEDIDGKSNAGKYKSFSVSKIEKRNILDKIDEVISEFNSLRDQIIIQKFEKKILYSGVIFTRDQNTNAPYFIINYDKSGKTNLVTSGIYNPTSKTILIYRKSKKKPKLFINLIKVIKSIEKIFNSHHLDIEFAIERKTKKIFIFQCRTLHIPKKFKNFDKEINTSIDNIRKKLIKIKKKNIYTPGTTTILSNMADWNPAEMIGAKPKNLGLSLYSELITNEVWSKQRFNYGYSNLYPNNLMLNLAGSPYIDLRTDLNSFIPQELSNKIKKKIIDYSINLIQKKPFLHDKIEFEVIPTCYEFSKHLEFKKILNMREYILYINSLKKITFNILNNYKKISLNEKNKLLFLSKQINKIKLSKLSYIQKIFYLVNDCKKYGTLPFAGLARLAFIFTKILKSFVEKKILTQTQYNLFFNQLETMTSKMEKDYNNFVNNKMVKKSFLNKYGHLRPSTYSINSPNYKSNFTKYFTQKKNLRTTKRKKKFKLSVLQLDKINNLFKKNKLNFNSKDFFLFAKKSIELREWGKFIFTKSIDEIFNNLELLGREINISKKDLDFISINTILMYNSNLDQKKIRFLLKKEIIENKKSLDVLEQIKLPDLITKTDDINFFYLDNIKGNFITDKTIHGSIKYYKNTNIINKMNNKIILIDNADPGYDFIFSYNIKGFISKYGGANSHMAIRCLELNIPAIIGIGEKNFLNIKESNSLFIDCKQKIFKILS